MIDALVYHRNVIDCFTQFEMILDFVRENDFFWKYPWIGRGYNNRFMKSDGKGYLQSIPIRVAPFHFMSYTALNVNLGIKFSSSSIGRKRLQAQGHAPVTRNRGRRFMCCNSDSVIIIYWIRTGAVPTDRHSKNHGRNLTMILTKLIVYKNLREGYYFRAYGVDQYLKKRLRYTEKLIDIYSFLTMDSWRKRLVLDK